MTATTAMNATIPWAGPVNVIREDPVNDSILYLGTDVGVYVSTSAGEGWEVLGDLLPHAASGDYERFLADATVFMEFLGNIIVGWLWLDIGRVSMDALKAESTEFPGEFYREKVQTMKFYFTYELPKTSGLAEVLKNREGLTLKTPENLFG